MEALAHCLLELANPEKIKQKNFFTSSNLIKIIEKALFIVDVLPVIVTILSGQEPSEMLTLAPLRSRINFTWSPRLPIILPTS